MKIIILIIVLIVLIGCNPKVADNKRDNIFLSLNAISGTISYSNNNIIYSSWDTTFCIYSLTEQKVIFKKRLESICYAKPIKHHDSLYFPLSENRFVCVDQQSGKIIWQIGLKGRNSRFDFIDDTLIVASVKDYGLIAISALTGAKLYELRYDYKAVKLPDMSPWQVSFDNEHIYVSNWQGHNLSCFDKHNGILNWHYNNQKGGVTSQGLIIGKEVFVGINFFYKGGGIVLVNRLTGKTDIDLDCKFEERFEIIQHGNSIYFYSYDSKLNIFDISKRKIIPIINFKAGDDLSGNQMFLAGDIYFTDASFHLNKLTLSDNTKTRMKEMQNVLISAYKWMDKTYFIDGGVSK